jgi:hypothetical protein
MCQSRANGGQRCTAAASAQVDRARFAVRAARQAGGADPSAGRRLVAAEQRLEAAGVHLAATPAGLTRLRVLAEEAAQAGRLTEAGMWDSIARRGTVQAEVARTARAAMAARPAGPATPLRDPADLVGYVVNDWDDCTVADLTVADVTADDDDPDKCARILAAVRADGRVREPIDVIEGFDGEPPALVDGKHRLLAAREAGLPVPVRMHAVVVNEHGEATWPTWDATYATQQASRG